MGGPLDGCQMRLLAWGFVLQENPPARQLNFLLDPRPLRSRQKGANFGH
jgi:hypothetical protein